MENEIWLPVLGYEKLYEVSNLGRVKALYREYYSGKNHKILRVNQEFIINPGVYDTGYNYVSLTKNAKQKKYKVHRLVGISFHENPLNKPQIDHKNGIRNDNRAVNLKWATGSENQLNPLTVIKRSKSKMGDLNPMKKKRICFRQYDLNNNFIANHYGVKETAIKLGFESSSISKCLTGVYQTAYGFRWYYL